MSDTRFSPIRQELVAAGIEERIRARNRETHREINSFDVRYDFVVKRFTNLTESLELFSDRVPEHDSHRSIPKNAYSSQSGTSRLNHGVMRLAKFDLPRFGGDKLKEWLFKVERFFEIHRTPDIDKINIAAMLMQDVAVQWHQSVQDSDYGFAIMKSWTAYRELLIKRFEDFWADPVAEQKNLRETGEQYEVIDDMIQSVQSWHAEVKAMFKSWREEDLIEKQKRKDELSPIEKYFAAKQSSMAMDALMMLCDTGQNTLLDVTPTAEIVTPEVHDPASASDPLGLLAVTSEGSSDPSLDSSTEVLQHPLTTDLSLDSCSDELVKEPIMLEKSVFATNPIMVKDSMVSKVSLSNLEPCLQVSTVSIGVGAVRQMEDDSCARSFESLQAPSAEISSEFFVPS